MIKYFLYYQSIDCSKFEFCEKPILDDHYVLLEAKERMDAKKEAEDLWKKIQVEARQKWEVMKAKGVITKLNFCDWRPTKPTLISKESLSEQQF